MTLYIPLLLSIISGASTMIGTLVIFLKIKRVEEMTLFSLSFSMTIMILISLFDLMPSSIDNILKFYNIFFGFIISILVFLLGYLSIYLINKKINNNNSLYRIGILSFISLLFHNLPEGMAVYMSAFKNIKIGIKMCLSIIFHNIPEGLQIAVPLYYSNQSKGRVVMLTLISALAEPLGALLSYIFLRNYISDLLISFILLFVSGLMISISINEINKETNKYKNIKYKKLGIIVGIIISSILFIKLK